MSTTEIWLDTAGVQRQHVDYTVGDTVVSRLSGRKGKVTELYPTANRAVVATEGGGTTNCEATTLELAPRALTDTERLDWIFRQADDYSCGILQDQPGDGLYRVTGMDAMGEGVSPRDALDAAVEDQRCGERERQRAQLAKAGPRHRALGHSPRQCAMPECCFEVVAASQASKLPQ